MKNLIFILSVLIFTGCASVPLAPSEDDVKAKKFTPIDDKAIIYVYRDLSPFGGALKKDITIDNKCVGESAPGVYFYQEVEPGSHVISTESEFSPNSTTIVSKPGELHFIKQYIKPGLVVGGADLTVMDENTGKQDVSVLKMAIKGRCDDI